MNAIILHGTGCSPDSFWFPSIKKKLEEKGCDVWVPQLPHPDTPDLKEWLPFVLENGTYTKDTLLIGHSVGCPLILALLEKVKVHKAILVAGYARSQKDDLEREPILKKEYEWETIKQNVEELVFINSDNDPWGCTDIEGKYMHDHLKGQLIVAKGQGHMGSDYYKQPYKEFPLLEKFI